MLSQCEMNSSSVSILALSLIPLLLMLRSCHVRLSCHLGKPKINNVELTSQCSFKVGLRDVGMKLSTKVSLTCCNAIILSLSFYLFYYLFSIWYCANKQTNFNFQTSFQLSRHFKVVDVLKVMQKFLKEV